MARLLIRSGPAAGEVLELSQAAQVLGRDASADVQIDDASVSRQHAKILSDAEGGVSIVDLESKNGTYVNGIRVDLRVLRHGDRVTLGDVELEFTQTEAPAAEAGPRRPEGRLVQLTPRELEVARLVAAGLTNADIATELGIKPRTVTSHLDHIYTRLGIGSRAALARLVVEEGALDDPA